jgi:hypothetical protein
VATLSKIELCRIEQMIPMGIPMTIATNRLRPARVAVAGNLKESSVKTGRLVEKESPRSKRTTLVT